MIKVLLAQILFKPAIIERELDWLGEPGIYDYKLGKSFYSMVEAGILKDDSVCHNFRERYIEYFKNRLIQMVNWAAERQVDLLVFPEYSVPYQCLPQLYELSKDKKITIVAGSHTVINACGAYYISAGLPEEIVKLHLGEAISPIFSPDGDTQFQCKLGKSIFEISMNIPEEQEIKTFFCTTRSGSKYPFSVLLCVDALEMKNVGLVDKLAKEYGSQGYLLVVPSFSPSTDGFYHVAKTMDLSGITLLYCNTAQYGKSGVYLNKNVSLRYMVPGDVDCIADPQKEEMIEINFSPEDNYAVRTRIDKRVIGQFCLLPVYYNNESDWIKAYQETVVQVRKCIENNDTYEAESVLNSFLISNQQAIVPGLLKQINSFLSKLSNFAGNPEKFIQTLESVLLNTYDIKTFLGNEIEQAKNICWQAGYKAYENMGPLMKMAECYAKGTTLPLQICFPKEVTGIKISEEDVNAFRDRGSFITMLQKFVNDSDVKIILVCGAYGIGKSTFVDVAFKKHYPDWNVVKIKLQSKVRFSMVLEQIGSAIGCTASADLLSRAGKNQLRPYMKGIVENIFAESKRCVVVDDLSSVLIDNNGRDLSLIQLFMRAVEDCKIRKGKLIFVGSVYFPKLFIVNSSRLIVLKPMERKYIDRILTYEMRVKGMAKGEQDPEISETIYDIVKGHPLSAKLAIMVLEKNKNESFQDIDPNLIQSEIINELIKKIGVHEEAKETMQMLSVFRTVIHIPTLLGILPDEGKEQMEKDLKSILMFSFVNYDGENFEILESIRIHYNNLLREDKTKKKSYYEYALRYYQKIYQDMKDDNKFNPMIYSELTYHYLELGRLDELKQMLNGNKETLKLHARTVYQQYHEYEAALQIYNMIDKTFEEDAEVLAYIGRCSARMDHWPDVEKYFNKAIEVSKWRGDNTWYIYRDWGHILVRYNYVSDAKKKFDKARTELLKETGMQDDPAILAAEGYICEKEGEIDSAEEKYKEALRYSYAHKYTIYYYSKLLKKMRRDEEARELENRINEFNEDLTFENIVEYEFLSKNDEVSYDDEY